MSDITTSYLKLYIKGKEIPSNYYDYIEGVNIKETSIGSNTCSIQVLDPDFIFIQGDMIVESTPIKLEFGVNSLEGKNQRRTFEGYVSVIDANFPEDGLPTATLHCMDKTHIMNRKKKTRVWENCTASSVAEKIFREYGFKVKIDNTNTKIESIQQSDVTDIEFVIKLTEEVKDKVFLTYIEGETAYFVERKAPKPKQTVTYRQEPYNLLSFSPRINKESKREAHKDIDIKLDNLQTVTTIISPKVEGLGSTKVKNSSSRK